MIRSDVARIDRVGDSVQADSAERWDAFISYRRSDGRSLAHWLRDRLQRYELPSDVLKCLSAEKRELHRRRPRIYIDQAYEKPSENFLQRKLYPALDNSDRLIVVSTPSCFEAIVDDTGSEQPNWLVAEIDRFIEGNAGHERARPIDIVLGPGAPGTRFPGRLAEGSHWDPADLRQFTWWRRSRLGSLLDANITKLVAGLYDVHESQLPSLYREEAVRRNRLWTRIAGLAAGIAIIIAALALVAWQQRNQAVAERDQALTNESRFLARSADQEIEAGDAVTGALIALSALPSKDGPMRPYVPMAHEALARAVWFQRERVAMLGHGDGALDLDFSRDGEVIATAAGDDMVRTWDAGTGRLKRVLSGHSETILAVAFSPDGSLLATGSLDKTARIWNAQAGTSLRVLQTPDWVHAVAFAPDGRRVATGGSDRMARIWDIESGVEILTLKGHTGIVNSVVFTPNGAQLITGSSDGSVKVWNIATGIEVGTLNENAAEVRGVDVSRDGLLIATALSNGTGKIWDATERRQLHILSGHSGEVTDVAFSADGRRVATSSEDNSVIIWDVVSGRRVDRIRGHREAVISVEFSPDDASIGTASHDGTARIWAIEPEDDVVLRLRDESRYIEAVAFSPNGQHLATGSTDGRLRIRDSRTGTEVLELGDLPGAVRALAFSPNGHDIAVALGGDSTADNVAIVWNAQTGERLLTLSGHSDELQAISYFPDGTKIATASWDGSVRLWDAASGSVIRTLANFSEQAVSMSVSPSGDTIAVGLLNIGIKLMDQNGVPMKPLHNSLEFADAVHFSPDGKMLAAGDSDGRVRIWNLTNFEVVLTLDGHDADMKGISYSPDSKRLVSVAGYGRAILWDALNGNKILSLPSPGDYLNAVDISPDGRRVALSGDDGRTWVIFVGKDLSDMIDYAKRHLPRCLTEDEEQLYFLRSPGALASFDTEACRH